MTDHSMIERVARAIAETTPGLTDVGSETLIRFMDGEMRPRWVLFVDQARAAIEAMREPNGAMMDAGRPWSHADLPPNCWIKMIDAALTEDTGKT